MRRLMVAAALLLLLAGCVTPVVTLADGRTGTIYFRTLTLGRKEFLLGRGPGEEAVISGELTLPSAARGPLPAVILMHGAGGVQDYHYLWARELQRIGYATFVVDSVSGRRISRLAENLQALSAAARIIDAYRALELLAGHPRIDPDRVVLMGFSHGGVVALYAGVTRFQRAWAPAGRDFAAYLAFYPYCNTRVIDDDKVTRRPVRLFHGTADDYTPLEPCRAHVERLRANGADVVLTEYPYAHHGFDNPRLPPATRGAAVMNPARCFFVERTPGEVVNRDTGQPLSFHDPCWGTAPTVGYNPEAYAASLRAVKEFLGNLSSAR